MTITITLDNGSSFSCKIANDPMQKWTIVRVPSGPVAGTYSLNRDGTVAYGIGQGELIHQGSWK